MIDILIIVAVAAFIPPMIYYAVKAARAGWLRAEQNFFTNPDNHKDKK